jgi:hypothetical protein
MYILVAICFHNTINGAKRIPAEANNYIQLQVILLMGPGSLHGVFMKSRNNYIHLSSQSTLSVIDTVLPLHK